MLLLIVTDNLFEENKLDDDIKFKQLKIVFLFKNGFA